jgi:hypothetical protein
MNVFKTWHICWEALELCWRIEHRTAIPPAYLFCCSPWTLDHNTDSNLTYTQRIISNLLAPEHADDCRSSTLTGLVVSKHGDREGRGEAGVTSCHPSQFSRVGRSVKSDKSTLEESTSHKETAARTMTKFPSLEATKVPWRSQPRTKKQLQEQRQSFLLWTTYQMLRFCSSSPLTQR